MFDEQIYMMLGADEKLLPYCVEYGSVIIIGGPIWVMQVLFQSYLVTADRPGMGLWLSIGSRRHQYSAGSAFRRRFRMGAYRRSGGVGDRYGGGRLSPSDGIFQ